MHHSKHTWSGFSQKTEMVEYGRKIEERVKAMKCRLMDDSCSRPLLLLFVKKISTLPLTLKDISPGKEF